MGCFALLSAFAVFATFIASSNAAIGPVATLNIANGVIGPDGANRPAVLVNNVHPGPLIIANKGDTFQLNVVNQLTDNTMLRSTSIHWHGFFQKGTNYADGPAGVTQCPISPDNSFLYQFHTTDQAGTYWYHSHFGAQYCDGLRGPMVVYDPQDPHSSLYDIDDESTVITLADWYNVQSPSLPGVPFAASTLINGKGRRVNGSPVDLAVITVQPGTRYRFRLVSLSCDPNYTFSIDGHSLKVIEADGENTKAHTVEAIQIFAGQRYSFVLETRTTIDEGNFWIRAKPNLGLNGLADTFAGGVNSAILRYAGAPVQDPTTPEVNRPLLQETDLEPLTNEAAPGPAGIGHPDNVNINLSMLFNFGTGRFEVDGASFHNPTVPVLLQILSGAHSAVDLMPAGSVHVLPPNRVIELSMPAAAGLIAGPHPIHLHGHVFSVVRSAGANQAPNFVNPVRRDVVSLGPTGSNVTIRFVTDNPGPWFLHCHIDFHLEGGLAAVFAEAPEDTALANAPRPPAWEQLCPTFDNLPPSLTTVQTVAPAAPTNGRSRL